LKNVDIHGLSEFWEKRGAAFAGGDRGAKILKGSEIFFRRNKPKHFEKYYKMAVGFFLTQSVMGHKKEARGDTYAGIKGMGKWEVKEKTQAKGCHPGLPCFQHLFSYRPSYNRPWTDQCCHFSS
jgi:hypothetical protein